MTGPGSGGGAWRPPPVDTQSVLKLGRECSGDELTPSISALCLRLVDYASVLRPEIDPEPVREWAKTCFCVWLEKLGKENDDVRKATLATDPVNLVLAARKLGDPLLTRRCLQAQMNLYSSAGMLSRINQTILSALLEPHEPQPDPPALKDSFLPEELLAAPTPLNYAVLALVRMRTNSSEWLPQQDDLEALALKSAWSGDLSGVGLTLVASADLPGSRIPDSLLLWIRRVCRTDGMFGVWQLFSENYPVANLLSTVNIYWGLATATRGMNRAYPRPSQAGSQPSYPRPAGTSSMAVEKAISKGQHWLDAHQDRFRLLPACESDLKFQSTFKPLVELSLLCYIFTRPRHIQTRAPWSKWALKTARRLSAHVEWEGLIEAFRLRTSATLGLVIYPFLASATGVSGHWSTEVRELIDSPIARIQERTPMREMDYQFTRSILGLPMTREVPQQISNTVIRKPVDAVLLDSDSLYDLTHVIFYGTQFGCTAWSPPDSEINKWLQMWLPRMALARLLMEDADLGAELFLSGLYAFGREFDRRLIPLLLNAQRANGSFVGPDNSSDDPDEFSDSYHTTLVSMAALAECSLYDRR